MASVREKLGLAIAMGMIVVLFVLGWWMQEEVHLRYKQDGTLAEMGGVDYKIRAIVPQGQGDRAEKAIQEALEAVEDIGARMNTYWEHSELSRFNQMPEGMESPLHPSLLEALRTAESFYEQTHRTFDVTILPILELYRQAEQTGHTPTDEELIQARQASTWNDIRIHSSGAIKERSSAGVDLSGMAKGFAIDKACTALVEGGVASGLVEIGGDMRCFGPSITGGDWIVGVPDPFSPPAQTDEKRKLFATLKVRDKAVCTSGYYLDSRQVGQKRYGEIIDPNDPTRKYVDVFAASVTVVAPTASEADIWATALAVEPYRLRDLLDQEKYAHVEAMIILAPAENPRVLYTSGFQDLYLIQDRPEESEGQDESRGRGQVPMAVLGY